jgi:hypothetical protein
MLLCLETQKNAELVNGDIKLHRKGCSMFQRCSAALIGLVLVFVIGVHFNIKSAFADVAPVPLWNLQLSGDLDGYGNTRRIKSFENLNNDEWDEVIGGTVFLVGLCFLVYLLMKTRPL